MHVRWDEGAQATPNGQLVFFAEFLATAGLFDAWVGACPLAYTSPNAPDKRDVLGTRCYWPSWTVTADMQLLLDLAKLRSHAVAPALALELEGSASGPAADDGEPQDVGASSKLTICADP